MYSTFSVPGYLAPEGHRLLQVPGGTFLLSEEEEGGRLEEVEIGGTVERGGKVEEVEVRGTEVGGTVEEVEVGGTEIEGTVEEVEIGTEVEGTVEEVEVGGTVKGGGRVEKEEERERKKEGE